MTQQPRGSGSSDLAGEFQRWLVRSGARGVSREVGGHIRTLLGRGNGRSDVWETATAPPPPEGSCDCTWCPVCRAARLLRESGPGLATHMSTAGDVLSSVVQEAASMVDAALANVSRGAGGPGGASAGDPGGASAGDPGEASGGHPGDRGGRPSPAGPGDRARDAARQEPGSVWAEAALEADPGDGPGAAGPAAGAAGSPPPA